MITLENTRFLAFDVETPNRHNDRMSSVAFSVIEHGEIVEEHATLLDPETWFDHFNSRLTGIYPDMVLGYAAFPKLWELVEPYFAGSVLLAHNAPFDLAVLSKCLEHYRIPWKRTLFYADTVRMAKAVYPALPDHKLNTVSAHLDIPLEHHLAMSDCHACAEIFLQSIEDGADLNRFLRKYDMVLRKTDPRWRAQ